MLLVVAGGLLLVGKIPISPNNTDFGGISLAEAYQEEGCTGVFTSVPSLTPLILQTDTPTPIPDISLPSPTVTLTAGPTLSLSPTPYPTLVNAEGISIEVTWGDYPAPKYWHGTQIPAPMGLLPREDGQVVILLMGNDRINNNKSGRTDTNMLLILNPETGTASILSIPRDTYVFAPGHSMMRLNSVQGLGGFELTALTYEYNFGIRPDYYVNVSAGDFIDVIDRIGGIWVWVPEPVSDPVFAGGKFSVPAGWVQMDGRTARWYVRTRYMTSDFIRNQRQQEVLRGIFERLMGFYGVSNIGFVYDVYSRSVETDITVEDLAPLIPLGLKMEEDPEMIQRYGLGEDEFIKYTSPAGGEVFLVEPAKARLILMEALSSYGIE